jgi:hypothetical protein
MILDPIITTLKKFCCDPVTKPPINPNSSKTGKPSDHLVVVMEPITATLQIQPRSYRTIESRPINFAGLKKYSHWIENCNWTDLYKCEDPNVKAQMFQNILLTKFQECFPIKIFKISCDDQPWISSELKEIDRKRKREFSKNQQSDLWTKLDEIFTEKCEIAKEKYYTNMVSDLKESNPGKWHSKLKRMSGQETGGQQNILVDELTGYSDQAQADRIANHYAEISNQYDAIKNEDFPEYQNKQFCPPTIEPWKVHKIIQSMNKKAATVT